jgi:hypothetical protein
MVKISHRCWNMAAEARNVESHAGGDEQEALT